ncbi:MAG: ATP-binding protein, partial [Gemmatimonadaceae bacterium]
RVASLAVPHFADWCAVDMQDADGTLRRLAVTHVDPTKVQLAHDLFRRYPPRDTDQSGVWRVLRTGEAECVSVIPDSLLVAAAVDDEHLSIMRRLGLKSYIAVPLKARSRVHGVMSFVTEESGRNYEADDLRAAEDLANRAVIAIENSSLLSALKDADRRKDEFIAMLAHELRNPLAPVRNAVEIIASKAPPVPELLWARNVIDRQVRQMTRLVDDLLDVSRISRGKFHLRKEPVALATIVQHALEVSAPLVEQWGQTLTVSLPSEAVYLLADAARLAQVLQNLLNNSVKYTEPGGEIWLTATVAEDVLEIRVRDTGVGIPADMLPRVFEMFTQVDRSLERTQGGLGIGLTLVQQLIHLHDGTVEAQSAGLGSGSEFIVRLPASRTPQGVGALGTSEDLNASSAVEKLRILVVDDNADAAESLCMLLELVGHDVSSANDGLGAVHAAEDFLPDVAILDIGLPKLNGYEAARRIRAARGAAVTLIALTGWGQEDDRRRSREAGFDHHLTKPADFGVLQKLLSDIARRERDASGR